MTARTATGSLRKFEFPTANPFIGPFANTLQVVSLLPAYYQYSSASLLPTLAFPDIVHSLEFPSSPLHSPSGWPSHGPKTQHAWSYGVLSPPLSDPISPRPTVVQLSDLFFQKAATPMHRCNNTSRGGCRRTDRMNEKGIP